MISIWMMKKNELLGKIAIIQLVQRVIHKVTGYS